MEKYCIHGHELTEENTNKNGRCKICRKEADRKWRIANPEKAKEASRKWKLENPDKLDENYISRRFEVKLNEIPEEIVELYKLNLQLKRAIRETEKEEKMKTHCEHDIDISSI